MRRKAVRTEQEQRDLVVRQGELTALAQHPAWPVLEAVASERVSRFQREAALALINQGMPPERQAFVRGFIKGMQYLLIIPGNAEARLEEWLREQGEEVTSGPN